MKWLFVGLTLILLFWLHITSSDKSVCCGLTRNWAPNIPFVRIRRWCLFNKSHRFWWNMRDWVIFGNLVWFIISYWQLLDRWWRKKTHTITDATFYYSWCLLRTGETFIVVKGCCYNVITTKKFEDTQKFLFIFLELYRHLLLYICITID